MYFVLLAAALAILAGVIAVAMGRGGEMAEFPSDRPAMLIRFASAADVAELRLPLRLFGYQLQATDEALHAAALALAEREAEIASLRADLNAAGRALSPGPSSQAPSASPSAAASPAPPA